MLQVSEIVQAQGKWTVKWHLGPIDLPPRGLILRVAQNHAFNFQLWHEEDLARQPNATEGMIAKVKRTIDKLNQDRNDAIEAIDEFLVDQLSQTVSKVADDAPLNTETPGSAIDRLSILALRIFHLQEQLERKDVAQSHHDAVAAKLSICQLQQVDLAQSLQLLVDDLYAGRKRHRVYRQMKMYNDPTLNPAIYLHQRGDS